MFHGMKPPALAASHTEHPDSPNPPVGKFLLTKRELSKALPMPPRTIEKLVANGTLPALRITSRIVRFELPAVLAALRRYQTALTK